MFLYYHLSTSIKYATKRLLYIFITFMTDTANLQLTLVACQVAGGALSNVDNTKVGHIFFNE